MNKIGTGLKLRSEEILTEMLEEYIRASRKFKSFNSAHEGYAVLKEEVDEIWDTIKSKNCGIEDMREEIIQIGAMALRFVIDICDKDTVG